MSMDDIKWNELRSDWRQYLIGGALETPIDPAVIDKMGNDEQIQR